MKLLIVIVAACVLSGISGETDEPTDGTNPPTVEELTELASSKFNDFISLQSQVVSDLLYDFIYSRYELLNERLELIACKWTSALIVSQTETLRQIEESKEYLQHSSSNFAIKLCSLTAKLDIALYVKPELDTNIQSDLMSYKNTLSELHSTAYSLFYINEYYNEHSNEVNDENASVESLQLYLYYLDSLMINYRYDCKSKAQMFMYKLEALVYNFENRADDAVQHLQTVLPNVNVNFQTCVYSYYDL